LALRIKPGYSSFFSAAGVSARFLERGLNGAPQAQNFSNKMLILIDRRSIYPPLFSGVFLRADWSAP
jgi:hypothetical protein